VCAQPSGPHYHITSSRRHLFLSVAFCFGWCLLVVCCVPISCLTRQTFPVAATICDLRRPLIFDVVLPIGFPLLWLHFVLLQFFLSRMNTTHPLMLWCSCSCDHVFCMSERSLRSDCLLVVKLSLRSHTPPSVSVGHHTGMLAPLARRSRVPFSAVPWPAPSVPGHQ